MDGKTMREMRREAGLTQAEVASALAVDEQTVSRWERRVYRIKQRIVNQFYDVLIDAQDIRADRKPRRPRGRPFKKRI